MKTIIDAVNELKKVEEIKPELVFTQLMYQCDELPSVGMDCKFDGEKVNILAISITTGRLIFERYSDGYVDCIVNNDLIEPILPLIAGSAYQFECPKHGEAIGFYNSISCRFININMSIRSDTCTNIQLLTVSK